MILDTPSEVLSILMQELLPEVEIETTTDHYFSNLNWLHIDPRLFTMAVVDDNVGGMVIYSVMIFCFMNIVSSRKIIYWLVHGSMKNEYYVQLMPLESPMYQRFYHEDMILLDGAP